MDKLEDPTAQLSDTQRQRLFQLQERRYHRWEHSLDELLRAKRLSNATSQMKVDAFCEYAAAHLYDNDRFAVYALLVIRELTQLSGLSPAAIDRLGETCRALHMALSEVVGETGILLADRTRRSHGGLVRFPG